MVEANTPVQAPDQQGADVKKNEEGKVVLSISGILEDLDNGLDRKAIGEKYGLPATQVSEIFKHPKLKGKKAKKKKEKLFVLEDDVTETTVAEANDMDMPETDEPNVQEDTTEDNSFGSIND